MRIVVDTNVVISGVFFGGAPRNVLEIVADGDVQASATEEIIDEYQEVTVRTANRYRDKFNRDIYARFLKRLEVVPALSTTDICRDPDDNKLLSCARDAKALFIVSGDDDLLTLGKFEGVHIITVRQFLNAFHMSMGA